MVKMHDKGEGELIINKLNASGPDEQYKDKLMLFGQFVGDWEIIECKTLQENGVWKTSKGELHWGWILDGMAVQDVWMTTDPVVWGKGTTIRFYDPKIDAWHSIWISPAQDIVRKFIGKQVGSEIVLETDEIAGELMRWIFFGITENAFRWRAETSVDDGKTWSIVEEMRIRRQKR